MTTLENEARRRGIETSYLDVAGRRCEAKPEVLEAVLEAMGGFSVIESPAASSSPSRAQTPPSGDRLWGVFLPLYALRSERSWGSGDFTDLERLIRWAAGLGARFVGTLPLLASFLDEPFSPSPYTPVSRLFWNEFFVDPEGIPEYRAAPETQGLLTRLRDAPLVDYREGMRLKRRVLEALATDFFSGATPRRETFEGFTKSRPRLEDYARFRAAVEGREADQAAIRYHLYVQWVADGQLAEAVRAGARDGTRLYLDFPLGVHPDGYDLWRFRDLFVENVSVGAPPDPFFAGGQNWGFPPLHPGRLRQGGLDYFRECLRHHLRHAGVLRIDHVMAFHRLFWIPNGFDAADGVYVRYPANAFYDAVCEESRASGAWIVGEDLGTVPPEVRPALKARGLLRSHVLPFESDEISEIPEECLAALNTHDMPPFAAAYERPEEAREAIRWALDGLARSPASLLMINLEDLWLEREPQNVPGTADDVPNWRRKARYSVEEFTADADVASLLRETDALRRSASGL